MNQLNKHFFLRAHSSKGLVNLIENNITDLDTCAILTGANEALKRKVIGQLTQIIEPNITQIDYIHSCNDPDTIEGILLPELKSGIFSDQLLTKDYWNSLTSYNLFHLGPENIIEEPADFSSVYKAFSQAKGIHDEWENIYISNMDFKALDIFTEDFLNEVFGVYENKPGGTSYHRFFGGATYKGAVDYVPDIISVYNRRYFIKGRPGSGKSSFMKKLMNKAEACGFTVYVYHCGFDPDSLDMVAIPAIDFVIFDSTAPHEYFPDNENDIIIDMYEQFIVNGTDEQNRHELDDISKRYKNFITEGTKDLVKAHDYETDIQRKYTIDTEQINNILDKLKAFLSSKL